MSALIDRGLRRGCSGGILVEVRAGRELATMARVGRYIRTASPASAADVA
jgi:hypothetical protein